jgi:hypothetical protein
MIVQARRQAAMADARKARAAAKRREAKPAEPAPGV